MSAASDEYRKPNAMTSQITASPRPSGQSSASTMPAPVATPLPPWKRWNTGKTCPRNTASAAGDPDVGGAEAGPSGCASQTANQPLTPSPISVRIAAALLPVRSTLVAPGLLEP